MMPVLLLIRSYVQWSSLENGFLHLNLTSKLNKDVICGTSSFKLGLKWAPILPWTTAFEFLKIHQPKVEILQFVASYFSLFLPDFATKCRKTGKNKQKLLASNCNISTLGWWIFINSKAQLERTGTTVHKGHLYWGLKSNLGV